MSFQNNATEHCDNPAIVRELILEEKVRSTNNERTDF